MIVVGNVIGQGRNLRLSRSIAFQLQILLLSIFHNRARQIIQPAPRKDHRSIVLHNTFEHFPRQVQPIKFSITMLKLGQNPQSLGIVIKPTKVAHAPIKRFFPRMAKRRVPQVMAQSQRFGQILIQPQYPRDGACDLRHFQRMGQPSAVIITLMINKNLCFILQTPKGSAVNNPIPVPLIRRAGQAFRLRKQPTPGFCRIYGKNRSRSRVFYGFDNGIVCTIDHWKRNHLTYIKDVLYCQNDLTHS